MKKLLLPLFLCATTALQTNHFLISALELAATLPQKALLAEEEYSRKAIAQHKDELLKAEKEKADRRTKEEDERRKRLKAKQLHDFSQLSAELPSYEENLDQTEEEREKENKYKKIAQEEGSIRKKEQTESDSKIKEELDRKKREEEHAILMDLQQSLSKKDKKSSESIDQEELFPPAHPSSPVTPPTPESAFGPQTEEEEELFNDLQTQQQQRDAIEPARKSFDKWKTYAKAKGKERLEKENKSKNDAAIKIQSKVRAKQAINKVAKLKKEKEKKAQAQASSLLPSENQPPSSAAATSSTATAAQPITEEKAANDNDDTFGNMPESFFDKPTAKDKAQTSTESQEQLQEEGVTTEPVDFISDTVQSTAKPTPKEKTDFETATEFVNTMNTTKKLDLYKQAVLNFCATMFDVNIIDWQIFWQRPQFTIKSKISQSPKEQLTNLINNAAKTIENKFPTEKWTFLDSTTNAQSSEISGTDLSGFILESIPPKKESHEPIDDSAQSSSWVPSYN